MATHGDEGASAGRAGGRRDGGDGDQVLERELHGDVRQAHVGNVDSHRDDPGRGAHGDTRDVRLALGDIDH